MSLSFFRLRTTFGARLGALTAVVLAVVFAVAAARGEQVTVPLVRLLCWVAAGPAALAAARGRGGRDRHDGIEVLVGSHGVSSSQLQLHRFAAAAGLCAALVFFPSVAVGATAVVVGASAAIALQAAGAALGGALAGALLGCVASACGEVAAERGRTLFMLVVIVPWALSDVWAIPGLSLVGALDAGLSFLTEVATRWA